MRKLIKNTLRIILFIILGFVIGYVVYSCSRTQGRNIPKDNFNNMVFCSTDMLYVLNISNFENPYMIILEDKSGYHTDKRYYHYFDSIIYEDNVFIFSNDSEKYYFLVIGAQTLYSNDFSVYMYNVEY